MKSLLEVLSLEGIETKDSSSGRRVAVCPFHDGDRDPSFTIYPNDTYYCFGCEAWGDATKFLTEFKHISFKEAEEIVGTISIEKPDKRVIKVRNTIETWKFLGQVTETYHQMLLNTKGALDYLHRRGLNDDIISRYKIGYSDGKTLNLKYAWEYDLGVSIGLIHRDGYELLSHRITIPDILEPGEVDFLIGRTVVNDRVKYLGLRMPKPIVGFYEIRKSPVIFLAEGQFDWLILRQWGYPAAILGGSHLSRQHQIVLNTKHVVLVPDNDTVGKSTVTSLKNKISNLSVIDYTQLSVKDIGEVAQLENGQTIFDELVKEQLNWTTFI